MKKCKINQLNLEISHPIDVLIGCVSYEQRCLSGATALKKINIQYTIYFRVKEFTNASFVNEGKLKEIFNDKLRIVEFSSKKPVEFVDAFTKQLNEIGKNIDRELNVLIDISTFTRESLIMMVGMLYQHQRIISHLY